MKQHSLVLSEKNEKEPGNKLFEVQKRTVVLRPTDILLLLLLLFLHTLCGMADSFGTIGIAVPTAALYAAYCCRRGMRFSLFLPLCGFFASLIVTANGYRAAGSLFAGLLAFCLFSAVSGSDMRHAKTAAVVRCTAALWGYVGLLCLIFRLFNPDFSFSAAIHSAFAQTEAQALEQLKALYDMPEFAEILSASAIPGKTVTLEALSETVHYTVLQTKYMSPAILTVFFLVLSYLTASLFKGICRLLKVTEPFGGEPFEITLSSVSLFCYFIASLGMLFARGEFYTYCRNIAFVLSPGFMLCGVKQIGVFFAKCRLSRAVLRLIQAGGILTAVILGNLGTTALILLGMLYTINTEVRHGNRKNRWDT